MSVRRPKGYWPEARPKIAPQCIIYRCACGALAHFGVDVRLLQGKLGSWYCHPCARAYGVIGGSVE